MVKIKEQDDIVALRKKNIIVSASAGSGKTTVMIRRIVDLVLNDNVKLDELLVLTYTRAAAGEMKQRLVAKMSENVEQNPELAEQIETINNADISTFDSFCQKLVKKYFYVLGLDPSFGIVSGSEESSLKQKAITKALEIYKQNNEKQYSCLLDFFASNRTEKNIKEIVLKIFSFATSILSYDEWKTKALKMFEGEPTLASKIIFDNVVQKLENVSKKFATVQKIASEYGYVDYVEYINKMQSKLLLVKNQDSFEKMLDEFENLDMGRICAENKQDVTNLRKKIQKIKDEFAKIKTSVEVYGGSACYLASAKQCKQTTISLFEICDLFMDIYTKTKQRRNVYDYNDIERLVIEILQKNQQIRQSIQAKYKYIFVDEFQDANAIQEKIINQIRQDDNVFFVGDLKQAIYGFRQSNSEIFEKTAKLFETQDQSQAFDLNCNFRSNPKVLEFINHIFCTLMTEQTAHLDYEGKAKLDGKAPYKDEPSPSVGVAILYSPEDEEQKQTPQIYSVKNCDLVLSEEKTAIFEARYIANKIAELKTDRIYDIKKQAYRDVEYGDITILLRKRGPYQALLIQELTRLGVPVVEDENKKIDETYDANVLTDLLYVCQNHKNDYRLASVMLSDLFCFDAQELSTIRQQFADKQYFYECVEQYSKQTDELAQKINNMFEVIFEFEQNCKYVGISVALEKIIIKTNYIFKIKHDKLNSAREQNTKNFIYSFAGTSFEFDIAEFLLFREKENREQKNLLPTKQKDVVGITTMHSSKGLEYPIVFIANLGDNFNRSPENAEIKLNREHGLGVKYFDKNSRNKYRSVFYNVVDDANKQDETSEKIRLLYVALTRAKNKLFLVGTKPNLNFEKIEDSFDVSQKGDYLSQIVGCFWESDIEKISDKKSDILYNNNSFIFETININNLKSNEQPTQKVLNANADKQEVECVAEYISKKYTHKQATLIAQKNTVSELSFDDNHASHNPEPQKLETKEHNPLVQKNQIGSLYHKILEECDFEKQNIAQTLENIKKQNLFDEQIFEQINTKLVQKNLELLREICHTKNVLKEQKFVMQLPYNEVEQNGETDQVLVQGVCDLVVINSDKSVTLVDYKYTSHSNEYLTNKYKKQLKLYKLALEKALQTKQVACKILNIKTCELIEVSDI